MRKAAATTLVIEPLAVKARLAELGCTLETLIEAALAYSAGEARATNFHPANAPGLFAWLESVGVIRRALFASGWRLSNERGSPSIVRHDGKMRISVIGGDSRTGSKNLDVQPGVGHAKGPALDDAVEQNLSQLTLGELITRPVPRSVDEVRIDPSECMLYVLLVHCTEHEARFELSCPTEFNNGQVKHWRERIVPNAIKREPDPGKNVPSYDEADEGDVLDVPMSKKTQQG